uniref:zinc ribbon domain-containing protein n=1 Tax=Streptomyces xanthochromogenes TaxID=67384 RepID=UPI0035711D99
MTFRPPACFPYARGRSPRSPIPASRHQVLRVRAGTVPPFCVRIAHAGCASRTRGDGPPGQEPFADWEFRCDACGMIIDRDVNAAQNIKNHATPDRP